MRGAPHSGFTASVLVMLALDLGVFHRKAHEVRFREALAWSVVWVALALAFNALIWTWYGPTKGLEFLTGYLIEKALSVDNIFVFLVIFSCFAVPAAYQHRVLFWGILGALVMRALFIAAGAALITGFHWIIYVFGGVLLLTGVKLFLQRNEQMHPEKNPVLRLFRRLLPTVPEFRGQRFTVVKAGRRYATTLLAGVTDRFRYLKPGLAAVLVFVGAKMMLTDVDKIPIAVSLGVVAGILAVAVVASPVVTGRERRRVSGVRPADLRA
jgi:tellurite resistance protein TerC